MALLAGAARAQLVLGNMKGAERPRQVAAIGMNDTCPINHRPGVTDGETTIGRITRRCTLGLIRLIVLPQISSMAVLRRESRQRCGMGSGGGTGLPFAAPSEVRGRGCHWEGASTQGLELQLPRKAAINQRAET